MSDDYIGLIPAAGRGKRLKPFTHTKPKPLVFVAGKPIIAHILDGLIDVVNEVVVIVGYMKDMLIDYLNRHYSENFDFIFVEQKIRLGLGHAVYLGMKDTMQDGKGYLITLGDEFFGMGYSEMLEHHRVHGGRDGTLGIKKVDNPRNYGIVILEDTRIRGLIEKPENPPTDIAIAGVYIIDNAKMLFNALEDIVTQALKNNVHNGEVQLTDALDLMVRRGCDLGTFFIPVWYDCGMPEMLLKVNRALLNNIGLKNLGKDVKVSVILPPTYISEGCIIERCVIGPYVSIAPDSKIKDSIISNSIIGSNTYLENVILVDSIIGDNVSLIEKKSHVNIGEDTVIEIGNRNLR